MASSTILRSEYYPNHSMVSLRLVFGPTNEVIGRSNPFKTASLPRLRRGTMKASMNLIPRLNRARIAFCHDLIMAGISLPLSLYLRVGELFGLYSGHYLMRKSLHFSAISVPILLYYNRTEQRSDEKRREGKEKRRENKEKKRR